VNDSDHGLAGLEEGHLIRLGDGGFGVTYRVSGVRGRPPAILKLMPPGGLRARLSARLSREVRGVGTQ
jgi:hypothetical protein